MNTLLRAAFVMMGLLSCGTALAEPASGLWQEASPDALVSSTTEQLAHMPKHYRILKLDERTFRQQTSAVPDGAGASLQSSRALVALPLPEGGFREFRLIPSNVMPRQLADRYPEIKSYAGEAVGDSTVKLRLDWSPDGLHAMVTTARGVFYIEPWASSSSDRLYLNFYKHHARRLAWQEPDFGHADDPGLKSQLETLKSLVEAQAGLPIGDKLRTYRLAVAANSAYSQFFGGTRDQVIAAIARAVNRVTGIYEQELSVSFQLVPDNDKLIFLTLETDPYVGLSGEPLGKKNQQVVDRIIGSANYDLGHVFLRVGGGGDGRGEIASVCDQLRKAQGFTGSDQPVDDPFWVDYVAHEIGHQMGGLHTFNSPIGSCKDGREPDNGFEIGSGITIMGYAGLCNNGSVDDNIQKNSIPYFHAQSLEVISANVWSGTGSACGTVTATGNTPPTVDAGSITPNIPKQTPFFLKGVGNDVNNDRLSYAWEEYDAGQQAATVKATEAQSPELGIVPLFRSFAPKKTDLRVFPTVQSILDADRVKGEVYPGYSRPMSFRLTVRDGRGGVAISPVRTLNIVGDAGPFQITKPEKDEQWSIYTGKATIQWDVAGTDQPPISCGTVNIALSLDDGKTYAGLAMGVSNNGVYEVTVPDSQTDKARLRILCPGKFFANLSPRFAIRQ